jgi:hypothetical protein
MNKNQQSSQDTQHGHQNEPPKKGQSPNDPQNKHAQDNPQQLGVDDIKAGRQRQGIGTQHAQNEKQKEHQNR